MLCKLERLCKLSMAFALLQGTQDICRLSHSHACAGQWRWSAWCRTYLCLHAVVASPTGLPAGCAATCTCVGTAAGWMHAAAQSAAAAAVLGLGKGLQDRVAAGKLAVAHACTAPAVCACWLLSSWLTCILGRQRGLECGCCHHGCCWSCCIDMHTRLLLVPAAGAAAGAVDCHVPLANVL